MKRVFAALRALIAESLSSTITEYNREMSKVFTKVIDRKIVDPMRDYAQKNPDVAAKLNANADEIESAASSYNWMMPVLSYAKKYRTFELEDILSNTYIALAYGDDIRKPAADLLPNAIIRQHPDFDVEWKDIAKYWNSFSQGLVVNQIRLLTKEQGMDNSLMEQGTLNELVDNTNPADLADAVAEEVLDDEIAKLRSYIRQKAKNPEEGKLFDILFDAVIANDYITEQKKKKFIGVMKKLPADAPNRENEGFWRAVWEKMRFHICSFFKSVFDKKGIRMNDEQRRTICSSETESRVAREIFANMLRRSIAAYVLSGSTSLHDGVAAGDYKTPGAMVAELREERKVSSLIDRVASAHGA